MATSRQRTHHVSLAADVLRGEGVRNVVIFDFPRQQKPEATKNEILWSTEAENIDGGLGATQQFGRSSHFFYSRHNLCEDFTRSSTNRKLSTVRHIVGCVKEEWPEKASVWPGAGRTLTRRREKRWRIPSSSSWNSTPAGGE